MASSEPLHLYADEDIAADADASLASNVKTIINFDVQQLIDQFVIGINSTVISIGARSYWLFGAQDDDVTTNTNSFTSKLLTALFTRTINIDRLTLSAFSINSGNIVDLLKPDTKTTMNVVESRTEMAMIENLTMLIIGDRQTADVYMRQALSVANTVAHRVGADDMVHVIIDIRNHSETPARMRLVQIAPMTGKNAKLNSGLSALQQVIAELSEGKDTWTIPFGKSKLTRLLQQSLSGNCFTNVAVHLAESSDTDRQTLLELIRRMAVIKTMPTKNKDNHEQLIHELREEIRNVRGKLKLTDLGRSVSDIDPQLIASMQKLTAELARVKLNTWDEVRQRSLRATSERMSALVAENLSHTLLERVSLPVDIEADSRQFLSEVVRCRRNVEALIFDLKQRQAELVAVKNAYLETSSDSDYLEKNAQKLEDQIRSLEDNLANARARLDGAEEKYKKVLEQLVSYELQHSKTHIISPDYAMFENAEFSSIILSTKLEQERTESAELRKQLDEASNAFNHEKNIISKWADHQQEGVSLLTKFHNSQSDLYRSHFENEQLWRLMYEHKYRQEIAMRKYQEHMFFLFRTYRSHFEEQTQRLDTRYRELLENSVRDALLLQEENSKLRAQLTYRNQQI